MRDPLNVSERKPINNKRYIILSTSTENNSKIHYPLTLNAIDFDNPDILKSHLLNLKQEMEELKEKDSISNSKASLSSKGFFVTEKP